MRSIENATFENPITIIKESIVNRAIYFLQRTFIKELAASRYGVVIPIERGGHIMGQLLSKPGDGIELIPNPMKMSHYDKENKYLPKPICKKKPKLSKIIDTKLGVTKDVFFAEAVVESQQTILEAQKVINQMIDKYNLKHHTNYSYPIYHTYALVSKISGHPEIVNFHSAFKVNKVIWVRGLGCDDKQVGRKEKSFLGRMSEKVTSSPKKPYYRKSSAW